MKEISRQKQEPEPKPTPNPKQKTVAKKRGKYSEEHFKWLRENIDIAEDNTELLFLFNKEFGFNLSIQALQCQMSTHGIKRKNKKDVQKQEPAPESKPFDKHASDKEKLEESKRKGMSEQVVEFISENYLEHDDDELREMIADKFKVFHTATRIEDYRLSNAMERPDGWSPDGFKLDEENEDL